MATLPPMFSLGAVAAVLVILFLAGVNHVDGCGGFDVDCD
jgi:hypothetical protein